MNGGTKNELNKILAGDMQGLVAIRYNYEVQAQAFTRGHNTVVALVCVCCIILILSSFWWLSLFTFLAGALLIYILRLKLHAAEAHVSSIDRQIRQKSLEVLGNVTYPQN